MAIPTITNSAINVDSGDSTTVDVIIAISADTDRVLIAFPSGYEPNNNTWTVSGVQFDPGGGDEADFTYEQDATNDPGHRTRIEAWFLVLDDGVGDDNYTVRVTYDETIWRQGISVWEVDGADTADPLGASAGNTGNGTDQGATVTTTANDSLVGAGICAGDDANFTFDGGDTEETDEAGGGHSAASGYTPAETTGGYEVGTTQGAGTNYWAAIGVEIFEAAGVGPTTLTVQDGEHTHSGDSPHLAQDQFLSVADGEHTQSGDSPHLSQDQFLTAQDGEHTHTADNVILVTAIILVVQDGEHTHSGDSPHLSQVHLLTVADGEHTQSADSPHLSQAQFLVVADGEHTHSGDNVVLTTVVIYVLVVQDGEHTHSGDSPHLSQDQFIVVQDGEHEHISDGIRLIGEDVLLVRPRSRWPFWSG